jgi:hypothetical protein
MGAEKSNIFTENFFPDYPIDTLRRYARELYMKAGKIIFCRTGKSRKSIEGFLYYERRKTDIQIYFTFFAENPALIQEYHIWEVPKEQLKK